MFRYTFAVIDKGAIAHNVDAIRRRLAPTTKLMIAVKANGYGHGAVEVAKSAIRGGAVAFAVAIIEEGVELRAAGIERPILVLGAVTAPGLAVAAREKLAVTYTDTWGDIANIPVLQNPVQVHVKVDTGMNRLGLRTGEAVLRVVRAILHRPDMHFAGLYTHLACADEPNSPHTQRQIKRFDAVVRALVQAGIELPCLHVANSGGALQDYQYQMVRVGISAYGYSPNPEIDFALVLYPALHLYSMITRVAAVPAGEVIGYGATYKADRPLRVATIPVGYADGYPRVLSNRGYVIIHGQRAPIVGRICMDQFMVDVTDIPGVQSGEVATLYGNEAPADWTAAAFDERSHTSQIQLISETFIRHGIGVNTLSLHEVAKLANTISYELMCAISSRVPRIYL